VSRWSVAGQEKYFTENILYSRYENQPVREMIAVFFLRIKKDSMQRSVMLKQVLHILTTGVLNGYNPLNMCDMAELIEQIPLRSEPGGSVYICVGVCHAVP
jgi:hypothetical protein